ncbi:MAG TPA: hypothetical protein VGS62_06935 [Streptosporangiaceae bacterium]|nr:hypothetical protein [Streptosporangiaceae bacterium]
MNLGNINKRLRLQCHVCGWVPPEDAAVGAVQLHFQVDHDTSDCKLDLVPACRCGEAMTHTGSSAHGKDVTDYFKCGVCGNTGYVTRKEGEQP